MRLIPRSQWTSFSHWLIWHGRRRCFARNPDCPNCEVAQVCPSFGRFIKAGAVNPRSENAKGGASPTRAGTPRLPPLRSSAPSA
jgi:hypothetical protein